MYVLARLAMLELGLQVVHVLDHARQDRPTPAELTYVGGLGVVVWVVVLVLALRGSSVARPVAVVVGLGTFVGFLAVHLAPRWSGAFSDPYPAAGADALSYVTLALPALVALAAAFAALPRRRRAIT